MTTDAVGGVWNYSVDLIEALAPLGVKVLLAVLGPPPTDEQLTITRKLLNLEIESGRFDLEWFPDTSDFEVDRAGEWLRDLATKFEAEVVHLNGYAPATAIRDRPTVVVAHSCVYSWWQSTHGCFPPSEWLRYRLRVMRGLESASAVVVPSHAMLDSLRQCYGLPLTGARVIHNFSSFPLTSRKKESFIFACGRIWDESKNLKLLDSIAADIDWPVYVAGESHAPNGDCVELRKIVTLGPLPRTEVAEKIGSAAIFAHPAKYEPFGLAVLEAARSGCALVLADLPSLREIWHDCALFISPDDPDAWRIGLNYLARNAARRNLLGNAARERSKNFNAHAGACSYYGLYEHLRNSQTSACRLEINAAHQALLPFNCF
jgi:glycosyltransferase involved in cell wall biosynthesis